MSEVRESSLACIGSTPLLHLARFHPGPGRLLAKVEYLQPGASVKDRAALAILEDARAEGALPAGRPVVEMTSGNMGAGLAVVCAAWGHPFTAVMSDGNSSERVTMLRALGARVELVAQVDGAPGQVTGADIAAAVERAQAIAAQTDAFYVDQFNRPGSVRAHEEGTGPELWRQTDGQLDGFVAAVGSGGTFVGTMRYLRRKRPALYGVAVEPAGARILAGEPVTRPRHVMQGIGYGLVPPHWDPSLCDELMAVTDDEATAARARLAEKEGLHAGFSAGANVAAAARLLTSGRLGPEATVATVLCDSGLKYSF